MAKRVISVLNKGVRVLHVNSLLLTLIGIMRVVCEYYITHSYVNRMLLTLIGIMRALNIFACIFVAIDAHLHIPSP